MRNVNVRSVKPGERDIGNANAVVRTSQRRNSSTGERKRAVKKTTEKRIAIHVSMRKSIACAREQKPKQGRKDM